MSPFTVVGDLEEDEESSAEFVTLLPAPRVEHFMLQAPRGLLLTSRSVHALELDELTHLAALPGLTRPRWAARAARQGPHPMRAQAQPPARVRARTDAHHAARLVTRHATSTMLIDPRYERHTTTRILKHIDTRMTSGASQNGRQSS